MDKRIKFLLEASSTLSQETQTNKLLRSYYLLNARKLFKFNPPLNIQPFKDKDACTKCWSNWVEGNYELTFESNKISPKAKNIVKALDCETKLTRKQKNRAKLFKKKMFNYLVFMCYFCGTKTKIPLEIKEKMSTKKDSNFGNANNEVKTNKNKDKNSSLPNLKNYNNNGSIKKSRKPVKTNDGNLLLTGHSKNMNAKSMKKKKGKLNNVPAVSKTQQKNTILQLAQLLKKNSNSNKFTQNNDRLKNLLK